MEIVRQVLTFMSVVVLLVVWLLAIRSLLGSPVGPSADFGRRIAPTVHSPPPPPDPRYNLRRPWFRLWGPHWLELKYAVPTLLDFHRARTHELAAFRHYLADSLPAAAMVAAAEIESGTRPELWALKMHALAEIELDARSAGKWVDSGPFLIDVPDDEGGYEWLQQRAEACRELVETLTGFSPRRTMVTLLPPGELPREVGPEWGYVAPKKPYDKICLLRPDEGSTLHPSIGLAVEYTRLGVLASSTGKAPDWLVEGLGLWVAERLTGEALVPAAEAPARRRLPVAERVLAAVAAPSPMASYVDSPGDAYRLVTHLVSTHGEADVRTFVGALACTREAPAFRRAFGQSHRRCLDQLAA